jgi:Ca2+/H+ antiporter
VSKEQKHAMLLLAGGLAVGAIAQSVVRHEAAIVGLSGLELLFLGLLVSALVTRLAS